MGQVQRPELEIKEGDVLLARANGARSLVGVACYVTETRPRLMLSDKVLRLIPDRTAVDPAYLALLLGTPGVRKQIGNLLNGGTGQNNITQADVRALEIPRLPLPQQHDIVAANEAFERRIGALERELAKLQVVEQAVVARTMAEAPRRVDLSQCLIGIESGWSPVCDSARPAVDEWGVLKLSAITSGKFVASESKRLPNDVLPRTVLEVRPGDVLVSRANGVKALVGVACTVGHVRPRLLLPDLVFRLIADPDVLDPEFLSIVLSTAGVRRQIEAVMRGTSGQYKVSQTDLRALEIPQLSLAEQREIVAARDAVHRKISAAQRHLAKLRSAQQSVVEDLLSGRSRVNRT